MRAPFAFVSLVSLLFASVLGMPVRAQPVKWILQDFPPAQMPANGKLGQGFRDEVVRVVMASWPEADHQFIVANAARTWLMLSEKEEACHVGAQQTPEREKLAYFTPFAVLPPLQLVVRKDTVAKLPLTTDGEVVLADLLASPTLKGMLIDTRSYGKGLDDVIAQRARKDTVMTVQAGDLGKTVPLMLAARRGDYILEYEFVLNYHKQQNKPQLDDVTSLPIAGFSKALLTNVVCPRSPWGQKTIRRIDSILSKTVDSNGIRASVEAWLSPETNKRYKAEMNAFAKGRKKPTDPALFE